MLNIVLYQPEIPPNTGNIIRLSANIGARLHLIKPYGFELNEKQCRRAGLDYQQLMHLSEYESFSNFLETFQPKRIFLVTTKVSKKYTDIKYKDEDVFIFGNETSGVPNEIREKLKGITLPMVNNSRSLNLSNSVAIVLYEAWRQLGFKAYN